MAERLENGRRARLLTVLDEYTRECLAIDVSRSFRGRDVVESDVSIAGEDGGECQIELNWLGRAVENPKPGYEPISKITGSATGHFTPMVLPKAPTLGVQILAAIPEMVVDATNYEFGGAFWTKAFFWCDSDGHLSWDKITLFRTHMDVELYWTTHTGW